jgi:hypothetical protein
MKTVGEQKYMSIGEVAKVFGHIPRTIKNWINWYEMQSEETKRKFPLPLPVTDLDTKGTWFFRVEDVQIFEQFKQAKRYGTMYDYSVTKWGEYGERLLRWRKERGIK